MCYVNTGSITSEDGVVWLWHWLVNLYIWITISSCCSSIPLTLGLIERGGGFSTLCHSCGFACQQRVLKTFPGFYYLRSEDGVVWLWHWLVNLYIWLTISSCYDSISLTLGLIARDGSLSTLCQSCRLACQQRVLKTSSADELFLERNASATICSWTVGHVTGLIVFHYFTSVAVNI